MNLFLYQFFCFAKSAGVPDRKLLPSLKLCFFAFLFYYSSPMSRQNNKLKHLVLVSKCSEIFMNKLLKYFTCLEILECGTSTGISDQVLESNISNLKNLKSLKVAHSKALSIYSVKLLLDHCFDLEEISDLSSFPNVTKIQLQELEIQLKSSNLDVRID